MKNNTSAEWIVVQFLLFLFCVILDYAIKLTGEESSDNDQKTHLFKLGNSSNIFYKHFRINGISKKLKYYYSNEQIKKDIVFFENGMVQNFVSFNKNGDILTQYSATSPTSYTISKFKDNACFKKSIFIDSNLSSIETYYDSGNLKSKLTLENYIGIQTNYSENGEVEDEFEVCFEDKVEHLENDKIRIVSKDGILERDLINGIYKYSTKDYCYQVNLKNGTFDGIYKKIYSNGTVEELYIFDNGVFVDVLTYPKSNTAFSFDKDSQIFTFKTFNYVYYKKFSLKEKGYYIDIVKNYVKTRQDFYQSGILESITEYNDEGLLISKKNYTENSRLKSEIVMSDIKNQIGTLITYYETGEIFTKSHIVKGKCKNLFCLIFSKSGELIKQTIPNYEKNAANLATYLKNSKKKKKFRWEK